MRLLESWLTVNVAALGSAVGTYLILEIPAKMAADHNAMVLAIPTSVGATCWLALALARFAVLQRR
jgi:hypothetical protein